MKYNDHMPKMKVDPESYVSFFSLSFLPFFGGGVGVVGWSVPMGFF